MSNSLVIVFVFLSLSGPDIPDSILSGLLPFSVVSPATHFPRRIVRDFSIVELSVFSLSDISLDLCSSVMLLTARGFRVCASLSVFLWVGFTLAGLPSVGSSRPGRLAS
jgi:hypothetical protein